MKKCFITLFLMLFGLGAWNVRMNHGVHAATTSPQIIIAQLKITSGNGQFITLYNNTANSIDLSTIQLQYFNNFDLLKATSGKLISLSGKVPAHGFVVVDDGPLQACYQMSVDSVSLGLSSTAGMVQVSHFAGTTTPQVTSTLDDFVGWSKTAATGAQTLPASTSAFLQRKAPDNTLDYGSINNVGAGSWTAVSLPDGSSPCDTTAVAAAGGGSSLSSGLAPVPYTVIASTAAVSSLPADDNGLLTPRISEILPNPAPPATDENDEFIELYNPNTAAFDLGGFSLQVGTTTIHKYSFPAGTSIQPGQLSAFYSADTGLSLSNGGGLVQLLDPSGNVLDQSDNYSTAKDGYAWVNAGGAWQWTIKPTPGAVNILVSPPALKTSVKAAKTTAASSKAGSKSKTTTKKIKTTAAKSTQPPNNFTTASSNATQVHPAVLAGIGAAALLYAIYEYRHDLANTIYKFRRNRKARPPVGPES